MLLKLLLFHQCLSLSLPLFQASLSLFLHLFFIHWPCRLLTQSLSDHNDHRSYSVTDWSHSSPLQSASVGIHSIIRLSFFLSSLLFSRCIPLSLSLSFLSSCLSFASFSQFILTFSSFFISLVCPIFFAHSTIHTTQRTTVREAHSCKVHSHSQ